MKRQTTNTTRRHFLKISATATLATALAPVADLNGDGEVNISDVTMLVDNILSTQ